MGGPDMAPHAPQRSAAPRETRGAPRFCDAACWFEAGRDGTMGAAPDAGPTRRARGVMTPVFPVGRRLECD